MSVDYGFVKSTFDLQDVYKTRDYIPGSNDGKNPCASDVAIGKGVDLGRQTKDVLFSMGVSASFVGRFTPSLGLKRQTADKRKALPPVLCGGAAHDLRA